MSEYVNLHPARVIVPVGLVVGAIVGLVVFVAQGAPYLVWDGVIDIVLIGAVSCGVVVMVVLAIIMSLLDGISESVAKGRKGRAE